MPAALLRKLLDVKPANLWTIAGVLQAQGITFVTDSRAVAGAEVYRVYVPLRHLKAARQALEVSQ